MMNQLTCIVGKIVIIIVIIVTQPCKSYHINPISSTKGTCNKPLKMPSNCPVSTVWPC